MTTPLLTPEDLRTEYGFSINPTQETQYESLIKTATEACFRYIGRDLSVETFDQYADGNSQVIVLDNSPVVSITGVSLDPGRTYATKLLESSYRLDPASGVLRIYDPIPQGEDAVKISYTAGYSEVPADILYCIAMTVQYMRMVLQADLAGVSSRTTDGGTQAIEQSIPPLAVKNHLAIYQRVKVK